ncbi:MAG: FG-GAP-like repeat-containing protein, partial [bacterium]
DTNGWLDFCTSNGNDMDDDSNGVYFNRGGTLETVASWRSADAGNFGHCYVGDVDNDGLPDLAVAYLGPSTTGGMVARIYRNTGGTLGPAPWWRARDRHSSFDCALGDFDLDGDLDLVISAGDAYSSETDSARIYRNNNGVFDTLPCWTARDGPPSDAVRFADADNDGDLDLFVGQVNPDANWGKVVMYRNNAGVLETTPAWTARAGVGWVLRIELGDFDRDGFLDLAVASNNQTGEPNSIKVFRNNAGTLDTLAAYTMLRSRRYSSCVAWGDANGDGYPELAAGGWWEPVTVFENRAGVLDTIPTWSWSPSNPNNLVCEALCWTEVNNDHLVSASEAFDGNGARKLFRASHAPLAFLDSVSVNGVRVPFAQYCADPAGAWASFASAPPPGFGNVVLHYRYSTHSDLAVTNWVSSYGNHLFLNTTPVGVAELEPVPADARLRAWPNPFRSNIRFSLTAPQALDRPNTGALRICNPAGRLVRTLAPRPSHPDPVLFVWDGRDASGAAVTPGIYFARLDGSRQGLKITRLGER